MTGLDWSVVFIVLAVTTFMAIYASRYSKSVSDFLSASRCARRYLIAVAEGEAATGPMAMMAFIEMYYQAGFGALWWPLMRSPVFLIVAISGWVLYRYRQSRAMTLAQFVEMRYSKNLRIFVGIVAFVVGLLFTAIFPAVGARFIIHFCQLPLTFNFFGIVCSTYAFVMLGMMILAIVFTFLGGQISVLVTDFVQGLFCNFAFIGIFIAIFCYFDWADIAAALAPAPKGLSMVNAFDAGDNKSFNMWFFIISAFYVWYQAMAWQGTQGYNSSAISPHEAKMGKMYGTIRGWVPYITMFMLAIAGYTLMHNPKFSIQAAAVNNSLSEIPQEYIRTQMTVPVAAAHFLPHGIMGALCALILAAFIGNTNSSLHSWGSIFVQDIVMPFRKKPLEPVAHMRLLKFSILCVGCFMYVYSLLFAQTQYIFMYLAVVGTIYFGGAGSLIIGGLYWKRGTTAAAWTAMLTSVTVGVAAFITYQIYPKFPINAQWMSFICAVTCITLYIIVSLVGKKVHFNLDKMLHRGRYAADGEQIDLPKTFLERVGITSNFKFGDKFVAYGMMVWSLGWCLVAIITTIYYFIFGISFDGWMNFWKVYVWLTFVLGTGIIIWFAIGGLFDLKHLFRMLSTVRRDDNDNGTVASGTDENGKDTETSQ